MNKLYLEKRAAEFRQHCGLGAVDPIRFKSLLSKLNVITIFKPLGSSFSGMAIKINGIDAIRFILVNSDHNLGKQHFTICHELYHLYIQKQFQYQVCNTAQFNKNDKEEYYADLFAAQLLLPEQGIKGLIPDLELGKDKISISTILKIEQYYSSSRTALLYRLKELSLISGSKYDEFAKDVKRSAISRGYSTILYESGNKDLVIGDYGSLAKELFDQEKISESHYISLLSDLGMNEDELTKIFCGNDEEA